MALHIYSIASLVMLHLYLKIDLFLPVWFLVRLRTDSDIVCLADSLCDITGYKLGAKSNPGLNCSAGDVLRSERHCCGDLNAGHLLDICNHLCLCLGDSLGAELCLSGELWHCYGHSHGLSSGLEDGGGNCNILGLYNWYLLYLCLSDITELWYTWTIWSGILLTIGKDGLLLNVLVPI